MRLVLMTAARQATTEVLPALGLLPHQVRVVAPELSSLLDGDSGDVVLVDARHDLVQARTLCGLLSSTGVAASLVAVLSEGGLVALSADWGVDDVLLDTAGPAEVDARLKWATARRLAASTPADGNDGGVTQAGELVIDEHSYSAKLRGRPLDLTYKEFELLKYLAQHPGRVFSRAQLLQEIWGYDYFGGTRTVDVHVRRLRAKLGTEHEALIGTVRNVGYKLDQQVADATRQGRGHLQGRGRGRRRAGPTPNWSDDRVNDDLDVADVLALLRAATAADGVRPLSEESELRLQHGGPAGGGDLVVRDGDRLAGYARHARTTAASPSWSCTRPSGGAGTAARCSTGSSSCPAPRPLSLWAHGDLPGSAELLAPRGFTRARVLLQMRRDLAGVDPDPRPPCPTTSTSRPFRPGRDETAWLRQNARAFAAHPEQGSWTPEDLLLREKEPWFDADGFLLAWRGDPDDGGELLGSHWTKVHPPGDVADEPVGEVYVLGVDPDAQGLRLGRR